MSDEVTKPRRQLRRASDPNAWHKVFIEALRSTGNVLYSCRSAGVARSTAYLHHQQDLEFARAWAEAIEDAIDILALEARNRALKGSDQLLMFLLRAHRPEVYRENISIEHSAAPPQKIRIVNVIRPALPEPEGQADQ
jgi:hypothetical protein